MQVIRIECQHKNHGAISMMDHPKNKENFEGLMEAFRKKGCLPVVISYDDEKPTELEK